VVVLPIRVAGVLLAVTLLTPARATGQSQIAAITYPVDGALQADLSQPIRWTTVSGAQAYYLYIGTAAGANDLVNSGELQTTSLVVASLPVGTTLHARMWTKAGGVWRYADSSFTASVSPPATSVLTFPVNGASGADMARAIQWTRVANGQAYYLYVGTTPGAHDLVDTGELLSTSFLASGLPVGSTLYARIWTKLGGAWRYSDSVFTAAPPSLTATITYPVDGAATVDLSLPIRWTTVANVQAYTLYIGTTIGASDLVNSGETASVSYSASSLPLDQLLHARMWTEVGGVWRYVDSTFTAAQPTTARLIFPADGTANAGMGQSIHWTAVVNAQAYYLYVGTSTGAKDLLDTGELQQTSFPGSGLPAGQTLFVRLWTKVGGVWRYVDSLFSAAASNPQTSVVTYPLNGMTDADPSIPIQWSNAWGQAYYLYLGTARGATDVVDSGETNSMYYKVGSVPIGQQLYARLWTKAGGIWRYTDSSFMARARDAHDVTLTFDALSRTPMSSYVDTASGFIVSSTQGSWFSDYGILDFKALSASNVVGEVQVAGLAQASFTFTSVDLYSSVTPIPYTITGLRNATQVFTFTSTVPLSLGNFRTVVNPYANDVIDTLVIRLTNATTMCCSNPMGIDNISLRK
jgi:hypothetical protein